MEILNIWRVPAKVTQDFKKRMRSNGLREDKPATILNILAGFNYYYETDESFGDITESTAYAMSINHKLKIKNV